MTETFCNVNDALDIIHRLVEMLPAQCKRDDVLEDVDKVANLITRLHSRDVPMRLNLNHTPRRMPWYTCPKCGHGAGHHKQQLDITPNNYCKSCGQKFADTLQVNMIYRGCTRESWPNPATEEV